VRNLFVTTAVLVYALIASASPARSQEPADLLGNHHESPVYYETQPVPYFLVDNKELLHENKLKLWNFPVVDVTGWNWRSGGIDDFSWWIQVEELRFLLPLLKSDDAKDRKLARKWFRGWYDSNKNDSRGNKARWREPMSAAFRGMVLVYFLKTEELREDSNNELRAMIREVIHQHQEFLLDPAHYDTNSNHGLVESFGLLEVTRVFPHTEYENTGLDRLLEMSKRSVSALGTHKEHSPPYHFAFLNWLDRFVAYLRDNTMLDRRRIAELAYYAQRMKTTSYFMRDHDGTIPEVGDADSMNVSFRYPQYWDVGRPNTPALYDTEAGLAVYKDRRRYMVFTIQNTNPELPFHYHNDVLSVYYRYRGETILGDPGKYEYTNSKLRRHIMSLPAHNTVFPTRMAISGQAFYQLTLAKSTSYEDLADTVLFSGRADHGDFVIDRSVTIPADDKTLLVVDEIRTGTGPRAARIKARNGARKGQKAGVTATVLWNLGYDVAAAVFETNTKWGSLSCLLTTNDGRKLRLTMEIEDDSDPAAEFSHQLVRGQNDPRRGWYAPKMFTMRPCYALAVDLRIQSSVVVRTRVEAITDEYFPGLRILLKGY
jgi:hypothetical protein